MQDKGMDFRKKEVINITDATRLGYVQDVCADLETGKITSIIVPGGPNKLLNFFSSSKSTSPRVAGFSGEKCLT